MKDKIWDKERAPSKAVQARNLYRTIHYQSEKLHNAILQEILKQLITLNKHEVKIEKMISEGK